MATRFEPNFDAFREMAIGPEMRAACLAEAEKARVIAEGLAADFTVTGDYLEHFNTRTEIVEGIGDGPRVAGILENDSDHAAAVEWGNSHDHKPHRVLGKALDGIG